MTLAPRTPAIAQIAPAASLPAWTRICRRYAMTRRAAPSSTASSRVGSSATPAFSQAKAPRSPPPVLPTPHRPPTFCSRSARLRRDASRSAGTGLPVNFLQRGFVLPRPLRSLLCSAFARGRECMTGRQYREFPGAWLGGRMLWLSRKHDVVPIPKYKSLRCAPNDPLQLDHRPHAQPKLPQQQMLNKVQREAPCPERQLPVADRIKAKSAQFEDEQ